MTSYGTAPDVTSDLPCTSVCGLPPLPTGSSVFQAAKREYDSNETASGNCQLPDLCRKSVRREKERRRLRDCPSLWHGPMVFYKGTPLHLGTVLYLRRQLGQKQPGGRSGSQMRESGNVSGRISAQKNSPSGGWVRDGEENARSFWLRRSGF